MEKIKKFFKDMNRYIYYKLIIPMKRERRNPKFIARATGIGLFIGLSPTLWQMYIVLGLWFLLKQVKFHFSLPIGLAWTWVSNAFTNIPLFYLYYLLGSIILGREHGGYSVFKSVFDDGIIAGTKTLFVNMGTPILIGSFALMVVFGVLGYFSTYYIFTAINKKRVAKKLEENRLEEIKKLENNIEDSK